MMVDREKLVQFLVKAKQAGYAAGDSAKKIINDDGSTSLSFVAGNWEYHDNYFGGEPYGGREVVFFKNKPVYIMSYYGRVNKSVIDIKRIYSFLREALKLVPESAPYRGPQSYSNNNLSYYNKQIGTISQFSGEEVIKDQGIEIYQAKYIGGFINQRN